MRILTCNIRFSEAKDGDNCWDNRKDLAARIIRTQNAGIICFQEMRVPQFEYLSAALPDYDVHTVLAPLCRDPGNAIFYRRGDYVRVTAGGYWLSKTPHIEGSKSWGSACVRMANWIRLEEKASGAEFRITNTHIDHMCQRARANQAALIAENAAAYPDDYPQLLAGDMNCDSTSEAIGIFKWGKWRDTYAAAHGTENPGRTYHEFKGPACVHPTGKMDWIFARGAVKVTGARIVDDSKDGKYPSDHYFVSADVSLGTDS